MVSYQPLLHTTAERELQQLPRADRERLTDVLKDVAATREPSRHEKARDLEGQPGMFRVRVGDVRAICTLEKPSLLILRVSHRSDVYEKVDELDERLEAVA